MTARSNPGISVIVSGSVVFLVGLAIIIGACSKSVAPPTVSGTGGAPTAESTAAGTATTATAGNATRGAPATKPADANSVLGWWQVPDEKGAADIRGGQLKLSTTELAVLLPNGRVFVRECPVVLDGANGRITGCGPSATLTLEAGQLRFDAGERERFTCTRIPADKTAALEATLAKQRPPADACDRARVCYRAAMAALGERGDEEMEFKYVHGATDCMNTTKALVMILGEKNKPVPAACK